MSGVFSGFLGRSFKTSNTAADAFRSEKLHSGSTLGRIIHRPLALPHGWTRPLSLMLLSFSKVSLIAFVDVVNFHVYIIKR
jgi:hypothetical protein